MREGISNFKKVENSYCIREGNLACWFIVILIIFLCLFMFNIMNEYFYEIFLPNFNYGQCLPPEDYMIEASQTVYGFLALQNFESVVFQSFAVIVLGTLMFQLKKIPREFSIMTELICICWILIAITFIRSYIVFYHFQSSLIQQGNIVYVTSALELLCLVVTGIYALRQTYLPN